MKNINLRYTGKVCVVTGAANGLGLNLTKRLIAEGAVVAAIDIEKDVMEERFHDNKDSVFAVNCDVSIKKQVDDALLKIIKHFGRIDVLFNNAGVIGHQSLLNTTEEQWRHVVDINLNGVFFVAQTVLRHMVDQKIKGVIVNTSSVASEIVFPRTGAYGASKGGVSMFTKVAALEMEKYKIRVCAFGPGMTTTRMIDEKKISEKNKTIFLKNIPMGRFGEIEESTSVALFLGSDEASYCIGQTWIVDGGNSLF